MWKSRNLLFVLVKSIRRYYEKEFLSFYNNAGM